MNIILRPFFIITIFLTLSSPDLLAQAGGGVFAYPSDGQDQEQQSKDQFECHQWAAQQSNFDPMSAPGPNTQTYTNTQQAPTDTGEGDRIRGAARGAAVGATVGAIAGDAGEGAAYGAAAGMALGGMSRRSKRREQQAWEQQQAQQAQSQQQASNSQYEQGMGNYKRAYSSCMSSRNYQVS